MSKNKLSYRPEIDGLRAIAVISVILYHAKILISNKDWFLGGYIGVDVFFVISGYLITRIILSQLQEDRFSFLHFYEKRARRILPVLFVVIFASIPFAWQLLLPLGLLEYAKSILASLFFGSNFFFFFSTTEYGADSALMKPFLHTWSLGVEEQFYLLFPFIAIAAFKFFNKKILTALVVISIISLVFAQYMQPLNTELNFYLPFSRFWELGAGAILATLELNKKMPKTTGWLKSLPMIGLAATLYAIFFFNGKTPHPGILTLIPIIGVSLIVGFSSQQEWVGKFLGNKIFVGIGLISYSAYLWHFPIFAFFRIASESPTHYDKVIWIVLTFMLSLLSYYLVEKPFRDRNFMKTKSLYIFLGIAAVFTTSISVFAIQKKGFPKRMPRILQSDLSEKPWEFNKNDKGQFCYGHYGKSDFCSFGDEKSEKNLYVVGDSNMESVSKSIVEMGISQNYKVTLMNSSACYFVPNSFTTYPNGRERKVRNEPCGVDFQAQRLRKIAQTKSNLIIIGGMLDVYVNNDGHGFKSTVSTSFENDLVENIRQLAAQGNKVVILYPYPRAGQNMGKFALRNLKGLSQDYGEANQKIEEMIKKTSYPTQTFLNYSKKAFNLLDSVQSKNILRVYPHKLFCDEESCRFMNDQAIFVVDRNHASSYMSQKISNLIFESLKSKGL